MAAAAQPPANAPTPALAARNSGLDALLLLIVGYHFLLVMAMQLALPAARSIAMNKAVYMAMELAVIAAAFAWPQLRSPVLSISCPLRWACGLWLVTWILAGLQAQNPAMALLHSVEWLIHGGFGLAVWAWIRESADRARRLISAIRYGFLLYFAILVSFVLALHDPVNHRWTNGFPVFLNVRHLGYFALGALVLGYQPLVGRKAPLAATNLLGALAFLTLAWGLLFWTGSRGAVVAAGVTLAGYWLFFAAGDRLRLAAVTAAAASIGLFAAALFPVADPSMGAHRFLSFLTVETDLVSVNDFSAGRVAMWQEAWRILTKTPLLGVGPDQYMLINDPHFRGFIHPHNLILQFALAWGVAGAALTLFLGGCLLRRLTISAARCEDGSLRQTVLLTIVALLLLSLIDGTLYHSQPVMLLAALAGVLLGLGEPGETDAVAPAGGRAFWRGASAAVALVLGLHLASTLAVLGPTPDKPGSLRQTVVQAFPTGMMNWYAEVALARWADRWQPDHPEAADALLAWAATKGRRPWAALLERAWHLHAASRHAESQALVKEALDILPEREKVILDAYAEILPAQPQIPANRH